MSAEEIDAYLAALDEPKRSTLEQLRRTIIGAAPDAEQVISYGVPGFKVGGKLIAGFATAKNHLSYVTHSGTTVASLDPADLDGFETSKSVVKMPIDSPLPADLVAKLIAARRAEAGV
jgi:uncharacterized protein YdhG (YjbR/CyaY superfamily)